MPIVSSESKQSASLLTPDEVAEVLRISKTSVYRLADRRALRFYRVCGLLRFDRADIDRFLGSGRVEPMGDPNQPL